MWTRDKPRLVVVGSGALGSACALAAARAGAHVSLVDPAPIAANASGIAAGMLAPAFEAALDPVSAGHFALLAQARDLWPGFIEGLGPTGLQRSGALFRAPDAAQARVRAVLTAQGARTDETRAGLFTPEDWRIEPRLALAAMRAGLTALGGVVISGQAAKLDEGCVLLMDGQRIVADATVLACGYGGQALAPELALLEPIKGQLLRYDGAGPREGPIVRSETAYLAPGAGGAVVGATMEPGRSDLAIDPAATERLKAEAARLSAELAWSDPRALTGVRASTPDGLPLIGPSSIPGVWLAAGARRNGWLFAPLAAAMVVGQMQGNEGGAWETAAFAPSRFPSASTGVEHDRNADL